MCLAYSVARGTTTREDQESQVQQKVAGEYMRGSRCRSWALEQEREKDTESQRTAFAHTAQQEAKADTNANT